jgi:glutaredoxin
MKDTTFNWTKYILALIITGAIFIIAIMVSNYFNEKKLESVQHIENRIAIDILSSETQFDLIRSSSCTLISTNILSTELNDLSERLAYMEQNRSRDDEELLHLKRQYSLLEIKDYLLMQRLETQCGMKSISLLYFYSNKEGVCEDCEKTGYILTYLREKYPDLRVYSFDYDLELSALQTLININKIENTLPAVVIGNKVHYGLTSLEAFEKAMPQLKTLKTATSTTATTSTSTKK